MTDAATDVSMTTGPFDSSRRVSAPSAGNVPVIAAVVAVPIIAHCGETSTQNIAPNEEHARHD